MKAVILAAGKGTRMAPIGEQTPKLLIPVFNKPLIHHFVDILEEFVDEIILVIDNGDFGKKIQNYIESSEFKIEFDFCIQEIPQGTAQALQLCKDKFGNEEKFIFLYGDDIYSKKDISNLLKHEYGILGMEVSDPEKWGIIHQDKKGNLIKLIEKPQEYVGNLANIGAYLLDSSIFDLYDKVEISPRGELEVTDTVTLFAENHPVKVIAVSGYWIPMGYPWHILTVHEKLADEQEFMIEGQIEDGVVIKGRLKLGKGSIIKSGSYIEGDCVIGENCSIGPGAFIRGLSVIGNNCVVGFSCEMKKSIMLDGSVLSHFCYAGHSIIGFNSNLSGGTILNVLYPDWKVNKRNIHVNIKDKQVDSGMEKLGAFIGNNVNLGAGTVVYPGIKISGNTFTRPGTLVENDLVS